MTSLLLWLRVALRDFTGAGYEKGRPWFVQLLWMIVSDALTNLWWCPNSLRVKVLRAFGAQIGNGVLIRYNVKIHWPWKLEIGDYSWLGEEAWILNLENVSIGSDCCISQQALICTGSDDSVRVATRATVLRGVTVGDGATIGAHAALHPRRAGRRYRVRSAIGLNRPCTRYMRVLRMTLALATSEC